MRTTGQTEKEMVRLSEAEIRRHSGLDAIDTGDLTSVKFVRRRIQQVAFESVLGARKSLSRWKMRAVTAISKTGEVPNSIGCLGLVATACFECRVRGARRRMGERFLVMMGICSGHLLPGRPFPDLTIGLSQMKLSMLLRLSGQLESFAKGSLSKRLSIVRTLVGEEAQFRCLAMRFREIAAELDSRGQSVTFRNIGARYSASSSAWNGRGPQLYGAILTEVRKILSGMATAGMLEE